VPGSDRGAGRTAVTAAAILQGDRSVLAALCEWRGGSVFEYCQHVSDQQLPEQACTEAFARFRRDIAEAPDAAALDLDAMLLRATRTAAARRALAVEAPRPPGEAARCAAAPQAIAARENGDISPRGRRRLASHLGDCTVCSEAEARALAAERAYREPSSRPLPPALTAAILTALGETVPPVTRGAAEAAAPADDRAPVARRARVVPVARVITRAKIREGDPGALAALCERRGSAVYAYCVQVAGTGDAAIAAADALAQFRVAVVAPTALTNLDAETMLRRMTRRAAASRGAEVFGTHDDVPGTADGCAAQTASFLDYIEGALSPAESQILDDHVRSCSDCAATLRRAVAGERAFDRAPSVSLPLPVAEDLLRAMIAAAPVHAHDGDEAEAEAEAMRLLAGDHTPAGRTTSRPRARPPETAQPAVPIAAAGIVSGDRDVLAALCARRGPAVLDYCRHVSASGLSTQACAEAFARFRVVVAQAHDPDTIDPDSTLLRLTRHAAAEHAVQFGLAPPGPLGRVRGGSRCIGTAEALAARNDGDLSVVSGRRLAAHLNGCSACREAEARTLAAEEAYRNPSIETMPPAATAAVMTALQQAVPDGRA